MSVTHSDTMTAPARRPGPGRPPGRKNSSTLEIEAKAKKYAGDALKALLDVARNSENDSARVAAASALLDRGYGRPKQALEHTGGNGGPVQLNITHEIIDPAA